MADESTTPDLVARTHALNQAGNIADLDAVMGFFAPDAVWDTSPMGIGVFEGRAAIRKMLEDWLGAFDWFTTEVDEVLDFGNGVSLTVVTQHGCPTGSKVEVHQRSADVAVLVDGIVERSEGAEGLDRTRAADERG
jgi:ketosteroid isomerase-like protein